MIYDRIEHAGLYLGLHPLLTEAFTFLEDFDPATADGQIQLRGDDLFVNVERYATEPAAARKYEAHRRYLDVQTIFTGTESIYVKPLAGLDMIEAYDETRDVAFYTGADHGVVTLLPGEFALFFPQDGHKPCCHAGGPNDVLKVVAKVCLDAGGLDTRRT
ncbi:MAG: YhcH/YjgK/YiaL family protein [Planctomycetota bacterium]